MDYFRTRARNVLSATIILFALQIIAMPCCWQINDSANQQNTIQTHKNPHKNHGNGGDILAQTNHDGQPKPVHDKCPAIQLSMVGFILLMGILPLLRSAKYRKTRFILPQLPRQIAVFINFFSITPLAPPRSFGY